MNTFRLLLLLASFAVTGAAEAKDCGIVAASFSSYSIDSDATCGYGDATISPPSRRR